MCYGAASMCALALRGAEVIIQAQEDYRRALGSVLLCYHREIYSKGNAQINTA